VSASEGTISRAEAALGAGRPPAAAVFDSDGVLLDTEPAWVAARRLLFARHGEAFGPAEEGRTRGTGIAGTADLLSKLLAMPEAAGRLAEELLVLLSVEIDDQGVRPLPGAGALLDRVRGRLPLAVASNSPHALLEQALYRAGLARAFDFVLGADDVSHPKPAPDLYLHAVKLLDVEAHATVAFEDSVPGVASARAAGLPVVAVGTEGGGPLGAHERVESLEDPLVVKRLGLDAARPAGR
jgi:HAD superfamily hydrolase (TIGR01509 family)